MKTVLSMLVAVGLFACEKPTAATGDEPTAAAAEVAKPAAAKPEACCDAIDGMSVCVDFPSKATASAECGSFEGKVKDATCPKDGLAGSCKLSSGAIRHYYTKGGMPNDTTYAQAHCKNAMAGNFTPPN